MAISTTILGRVHWISIYTPLEKSPPLLEGLISPIPLSLQKDCEFTEGLDALVLDDPVAPAVPKAGNQVNFELWKVDMKEF